MPPIPAMAGSVPSMADVKPKFDPHPPEPDAFTKKVRAVCGALLGLFIGFEILKYFGPFGQGGVVVVFGGAVAASALLAVRYGDDFWREAIDWWR